MFGPAERGCVGPCGMYWFLISDIPNDVNSRPIRHIISEDFRLPLVWIDTPKSDGTDVPKHSWVIIQGEANANHMTQCVIAFGMFGRRVGVHVFGFHGAARLIACNCPSLITGKLHVKGVGRPGYRVAGIVPDTDYGTYIDRVFMTSSEQTHDCVGISKLQSPFHYKNLDTVYIPVEGDASTSSMQFPTNEAWNPFPDPAYYPSPDQDEDDKHHYDNIVLQQSRPGQNTIRISVFGHNTSANALRELLHDSGYSGITLEPGSKQGSGSIMVRFNTDGEASDAYKKFKRSTFNGKSIALQGKRSLVIANGSGRSTG